MARPNLAEVVKKVRLTRAQARRLRAVADRVGVSESDVLRRGVDLVEKDLERERALQKLLEWAERDKRYLRTKRWRAGGFR